MWLKPAPLASHVRKTDAARTNLFHHLHNKSSDDSKKEPISKLYTRLYNRRSQAALWRYNRRTKNFWTTCYTQFTHCLDKRVTAKQLCLNCGPSVTKLWQRNRRAGHISPQQQIYSRAEYPNRFTDTDVCKQPTCQTHAYLFLANIFPAFLCKTGPKLNHLLEMLTFFFGFGFFSCAELDRREMTVGLPHVRASDGA